MKKYLSGFLAIVLAIGFSSFTSTKEKDENAYYFYHVDSSGIIPSGASYQFGGAVSLSHADANDGCPTPGLNDCMRGFTTQPSLPTALPGEAQTKKN